MANRIFLSSLLWLHNTCTKSRKNMEIIFWGLNSRPCITRQALYNLSLALGPPQGILLERTSKFKMLWKYWECIGKYWEVLSSIGNTPILPYHSYHIITYDRFSEWIIHLRKWDKRTFFHSTIIYWAFFQIRYSSRHWWDCSDVGQQEYKVSK